MLILSHGSSRLKYLHKVNRIYKSKGEKIKNKVKELVEGVAEKRRLSQTDREIYEGISFLRNMLAIEAGRKLTTDMIVSELGKKEGVLQESYLKMLSLLRVNRRGEAQEFLRKSFGTSAGREFAALLLKWDQINPEELSEVLISHQKVIKEIQITKQKQRDEAISDLMYFPVIVNAVFIFVNFVYVGYFMSQKEVLQSIFNY